MAWLGLFASSRSRRTSPRRVLLQYAPMPGLGARGLGGPRTRRIHDGAPVRSYARVGNRELMASLEFHPGCGGTHTGPISVEHNQCIRLRSSAATRVAPEAALRWPAGVGWRSGMEIQRPWLPLPVKGGRERDVRNRTRGREERRRGGQGGALVQQRRSDGRPARGGGVAAMASASCEGERGR